MKLLLKNIAMLLQIRPLTTQKVSGPQMKELPSLENAWLLLEDDVIHSFGNMSEMPNFQDIKTLDCSGKTVLPSWCDSHTHLVYAGNREQEFVDRINGLSYQEIAASGGGIVNSAKKLQATTQTALFAQSEKRLQEVIQQGTGAIEIKSGYGLTTQAEMKMLRVAKQLGEKYNITVKTTFLGAHAIPPEFKGNKDGYLDLVCGEMMEKISSENLADYVDVFCEKGYFSVADTNRVLQAGKKHGLIAKTHVNQFKAIGGVAVSVKNDALSVDHLEVLNKQDITALQESQTMPVALPLCSYFLSIPYTPGREIIDAGLPLALASDYNPGSSPSGNMNFVVATACIKMKLSPEEAINAATINGAYAMGLSESHGSITKGKKANLIITKEIPSYGFLPYAFGSNNIDQVILNGTLV
ncbi:imidazolonepropionase [Flavobacteriaceae bacterium]|nr:imidazolonepropionase [Flavobacteriaceae bacterium]MDA9283634.1 imidazolonepropionase [Flavobacteriaceae bacterium]MDA9780708.1 imidazolonepropionase [Flavobacteriaceae bacterium]